MLRKLCSCSHRELSQLLQSGARAGQTSQHIDVKLKSTHLDCGTENYSNDCKILKKDLTLDNKKNKYVPVQIAVTRKSSFISQFKRYFDEHRRDKHNAYEGCEQKKDRRTFDRNTTDDLHLWWTGVLGISSVILGHKWLHQNKKSSCFLHAFDKNILQQLLLNYIPRDHLVLAINSTPNCASNIKNLNGTLNKESFVKAEKQQINSKQLDETVAKFQQVADECSGSLLNTLALKQMQTKQHKEAFSLFKEASLYGHVASLYNLGLCYELGKGVPKSHDTAALYYKQAAEKGHVKSMYNLAMLYYDGILQNDHQGWYFIKMAADHGLVKAQSFVALRYADKHSYKEAVKYFKMAALQDDMVSIFNLAVCFEHGFGVQKNISKAMSLYHKSAVMGHPLSEYHLGKCYQHELLGVSKNLQEALKWFKRSSKHGYKEAAERVDLIEYEIHQRSEDMLMNILEPSASLKLLNPLEKVLGRFHQSTSMPNLTVLAEGNNVAKLKKRFKDGSTSVLDGKVCSSVVVGKNCLITDTNILSCKLQQAVITETGLNERMSII